MQKILQHYLRRLTNLTGNNRSLLLLRLISDQTIDLHELDFLENQPSFSLIEGLIARKGKQTLCAQLDPRNAKNNEVSKRLKKIQRIEQFIFEERGARDLYVGWPFVRGKFSDGTLVRCPLMFFPVALQVENGEWQLMLRKDVNLTLNKTFLLAYAYFNQVKIEDSLIEGVIDDFDPDSRVFRTMLYQMLKDSPIELNFNQENFVDRLQSFENYKKSELEADSEPGLLKLYPEAVLGIFPQAGSYLVPDYVQLLEETQVSDIDSFFTSRSDAEDIAGIGQAGSSRYFLNKVKEEVTFTPFPLDAFQENALKAVKKGNSLVVQGPPGTGKSQLICNLVSDFMARGKRVLLVCQKRAALDVVYSRLREMEFASFVALVHDFKNDRKSIYEQIDAQIEKLNEYQQKNNSLDAIQLERTFLQASRRIDQITDELEEFKAALFDDQECGLAIKELYLTSDLSAPTLSLRQEYKFFPFPAVPEFLRKLKAYVGYATNFEDQEYPWRNRKDFSGLNVGALPSIKEVIEEIPAFQRELGERSKPIVGTSLEFETLETLHSRAEKVREMLKLLKPHKVYDYFRHRVREDRPLVLLWLNNMEKNTLSCFAGEGPENSLTLDQVGKFQATLERARHSRKGLIGGLRWSLFSKDKKWIQEVVERNGLSKEKEQLQILEAKLDNRLNLEHNLTKLRENKNLSEIPDTNIEGDFQAWFALQKDASKAYEIFLELRNFKEYFNFDKLTYRELVEQVENLLVLAQEMSPKRTEWELQLTKGQVGYLLNDPEAKDRYLRSLDRDFEDLCDYDRLRKSFTIEEEKLVEKLWEETEDRSWEAMETLFQNSLRLAWINHIETKYPVLRSVSSQKFDRLIQELQQAVTDKQTSSREIVLLRAREQTYDNLEFNRLNNRVTYRDLQHQVTKKKKIWPIRKVIGQFSDELFQLLPCWMASPESVSAIFPMEEMFDVIIFDEASQCFAERGIPAMYRGKQVVVVGDDKQLSPNDLYKVRWEEDDTEEVPALEVDSLLQLASQHLMQVQLNGHYRSRSLELIDFSNHQFYRGQLRLLPDREDLNQDEPAIRYHKVDGVWENNANVKEAQAVIDLVKSIQEEAPNKTVGVVTFNARQQSAVLDILEEEQQNGIALPPDFFVKNIENVQGDERDIIIFSTAYGPNAKGKVMMNFGALNTVKGENRLNVAITRARQRIYMVTSIWPKDLRTEGLKNDGPKLLKAYLQYALDVSEGRFKAQLPSQNRYQDSAYLKEKIRQEMGNHGAPAELAADLPFADLTVRKGETFHGVLLTDDDLYHQSPSVKDSHVYLPFTFEDKRWPYRFVFSRNYWKDPAQEEERLIRYLNVVDGTD
ncbi:MAG TPA: DNA helicase I [Cytophagales bacterium]|nr:DNA helicase I [Cytophagales bacterium]